MQRKFGAKSEWEKHPIYHVFYELSKKNSQSGKDVEWYEDSDGDIIGISIPQNDGVYRSYRRMFKGYDQVSREIFEETFYKN